MECNLHWVFPFGYLRIKACLRLPEAFRSLPRPSSPYVAKASACCSLYLVTQDGLSFPIPIQLSMNSFRSHKEHFRNVPVLHRFEFTRSLAPSSSGNRCSSCTFASQKTEKKKWWSWTESNRLPPACKAGALPNELQPLITMVGLERLELSTSRLSGVRSNHLSYRPESIPCQ